MPGSPAVPKNSAYSDQSHDDSVPTLISVSMVAVPCLRLAQAARWNGHAAQSTTGVASCRLSHCQLSNCSGLIIDIASSGMDSAADTTSRRLSAAVGSSACAGCSSEESAVLYPAASTASMSSSGATESASYETLAVSVA